MGNAVVAAVETRVDPAREAALIEGFRVLNEGERPEGLPKTHIRLESAPDSSTASGRARR